MAFKAINHPFCSQQLLVSDHNVERMQDNLRAQEGKGRGEGGNYH